MSHSFHNKLQDNAESSDTFINKAALTVASYTGTVYYKYNRIPVFYPLPFALMETNSKMGLFQHFVCIFSINFFYLYVYLSLETCLKFFYLWFFSVTLLTSYYFYLFFLKIQKMI